jgi:hypothetical protein
MRALADKEKKNLNRNFTRLDDSPEQREKAQAQSSAPFL